jgi:hypothetical protein
MNHKELIAKYKQLDWIHEVYRGTPGTPSSDVMFRPTRKKAPWAACHYNPNANREKGERPATSLGYFDTPEKAAMAIDKKEVELVGEKAKLFFPDKLEQYLAEVKNEKGNG